MMKVTKRKKKRVRDTEDLSNVEGERMGQL